jgi:hypothetical protein
LNGTWKDNAVNAARFSNIGEIRRTWEHAGESAVVPCSHTEKEAQQGEHPPPIKSWFAINQKKTVGTPKVNT